MKKLLLTLLIPTILFAEPQIQETISPMVKSSEGVVQFTITTEAVQNVVMSLDDLLNKKKQLEQTIFQAQEQINKVNAMISEAKGLGVKTGKEIHDAQAAIDAAKEAEKAAQDEAFAAEVLGGKK